MPTVFLTSDTHFGHLGVCKFLRDDGSKLRPWNTPQEMDEELVKRWNSVVKPTDKVYHLGDVAMDYKALPILLRLNGDKVLIKGNHDIYKLRYYTPYFRDIRAYHVLDKIAMSHIPVHPDCLERFKGNIHGHLHYREVLDSKGKPDLRYFNVSVERINYTPISFEEIKEKTKW